MADVAAYHLTEEEKQRLLDPAVGGVILFRRNFENVSQLKALVQEIKAVRTPELIIAVDHEGGRVQRFIDGFTRLPAMNVLGEIWDNEGKEAACAQAEQVGWVLATELSACGIDYPYTCIGFRLGSMRRHRQPQFPPRRQHRYSACPCLAKRPEQRRYEILRQTLPRTRLCRRRQPSRPAL